MESWSGFAALAVICVTILVFRVLDHCWQVERDERFAKKERGEWHTSPSPERGKVGMGVAPHHLRALSLRH